MAVELYDEHEQSERVRSWLKENGFSLAMGVALALAGIFGWRQWLDYKANQGVIASDYYTTIQREVAEDRLASAQEQFAMMSDSVDGHAYTTLAAMLVAGAEAEAGELDSAAARYDELLERTEGQSLNPIVRVRRARLYAAEGQAEQGLGLIDGASPTGYESLWFEVRGDLLASLDRFDDAAAAYEQAAEQLRGEGSNPRLVETKLNAIRSAAGIAEVS